MVLTFRAGKFAAFAAAVVALAGLVACSREQQDWRSAEASDTVDAYSGFLKDHPDSELVKQARARLTQLSEDRAWSQAGSADTVDAYKQFLAQYPNGKWSQEARIRVENFELGTAGTAAGASVPGVGAAVGANVVSVGAPTGANVPGAPAATASTNGPGWSDGTTSAPASVAAGESAQAPAQSTSTQSSVAATQPSTQVAAGAAAQLPTPQPGTEVQSPRPSTYPAAATSAEAAALSPSATATVPTPPASIAAAWRSTDPTSYGVQLGAFASENAAASEWQQLVERFNAQLRGLAPHVVSAETATGRLFRLQALVADEATARALCDMLRKQSQACVPVLPH